jgi:hypothetical protein
VHVGFDVVVDTAYIGMNDMQAIFVKQVGFLLGNPPKSQGTDEAVCIECQWTKHLGKLPVSRSTVELHLPKPILGMDVAKRSEEVVVVVGVDVGNAPSVTHHLDRAMQVVQWDGAGSLGQGLTEPLGQVWSGEFGCRS